MNGKKMKKIDIFRNQEFKYLEFKYLDINGRFEFKKEEYDSVEFYSDLNGNIISYSIKSERLENGFRDYKEMLVNRRIEELKGKIRDGTFEKNFMSYPVDLLVDMDNEKEIEMLGKHLKWRKENIEVEVKQVVDYKENIRGNKGLSGLNIGIKMCLLVEVWDRNLG